MRRFLAAAIAVHAVKAQADLDSAEEVHFDRTPNIQATQGKWDAAYAKAEEYLTQFNLTQKVALATGVGWMNGPCVGNTPAIPEVGFPGLCLQDGPLGIRFSTNSSAFPAAINAAATWNRDLIYRRAVALGQEFRGKGVNVALGPGMNMARVAAGGRNWEGFGGDPYLAGEAAAETVKGLQSQGVQATAKHYLFNEQEHYRDSSSSNVDRRTTHELYAAPFLKSVQAGAAAVMCSYNQIENIWACEQPEFLTEILKEEYGFRGFVMSDWQATHSTISAANGLDMTMPGDRVFGSGDTYFGNVLVDYVQNGTIPESRVDDMAKRILASWYLVDQDQGYPETSLWSWDLNDPRNGQVPVQGDHDQIIREVGKHSIVLLKNTNGALPLKKPESLAIVGTDARVSPLGPNGYADRGGNDGTLAMGWGSGTSEFPYLVDPLTAISARAEAEGTTIATSLSDSDHAAAAAAAAGKDAALVFINSDSGEGYIWVEGHAGDRNDLYAWHGGDQLVQAVAAVNPNTIVVYHSVGATDMEAWIEHPNVTAVVWPGLPGQESGNSLVDVLYGDHNPSGRLPYTIGKHREDYAADVLYSDPAPIPQINYSEGLLIDYRWFDAKNIEPRFAFGFGLSYTTFEYGLLAVWPYGFAGGARKTLDPTLYEKVATVTFTLRNSGSVDGTEVPQLYVHFPQSSGSPPKVLKGFENVFLKKKQVKIIKLDLTRYDLSTWNQDTKTWSIPKGRFGISVGASSRDLRLKGTLSLF